MKKIIFIFLIIISVSCNETEDENSVNTLSSYIGSSQVETGAVISCAGSDVINGDVLVYYYPENDAKDVTYYETTNLEVNNKDYTVYKRVNINSEDYFNGYLGIFRKKVDREKWVLVSYKLNNEIKLSNPIRLRHLTKPTIWTDEVQINQAVSTMPIFTWVDNANGDNAIYFQVVSDMQNNLVSGTYTYDNYFQYYNTSNVVLNITTQSPPDLLKGNLYNFTMLDVGIDNWVNTIIEKTFIVK